MGSIHKLTATEPEPLAGPGELITVVEFARRVHRDRRTVYSWIRTREMPEGTVYDVHGRLEIDWTAWQRSLALKRII